MNRETQASWWREMGEMSRGLDLLQGGNPVPDASPVAPACLPRPRTGLARLLHTLSFLGGRPMHAGHNADLNEPFEALPSAHPAQILCSAC